MPKPYSYDFRQLGSKVEFASNSTSLIVYVMRWSMSCTCHPNRLGGCYSKTLEEVVNSLTEHIPIQTQGKCEQQNIFEILIRAATQKDSIENTSKVLKNVPTSNDIRYHLEKYSDLNSLEVALNKALQNRLPSGIRQGQQKVAIDFNLIPYYGEPSPEEAPYIYRSKAKSGTCSFYAYATKKFKESFLEFIYS